VPFIVAAPSHSRDVPAIIRCSPLRVRRPDLAARRWPRNDPFVIDLECTICKGPGHKKHGAAYVYTKVFGYHSLLRDPGGTGETSSLGANAQERLIPTRTSVLTQRFVVYWVG